jgi:hypothetical protein
MRWLRPLAERGVAAPKESKKDESCGNDDYGLELDVVTACAGFGMHSLEPSSGPFQPPPFLMKVA